MVSPAFVAPTAVPLRSPLSSATTLSPRTPWRPRAAPTRRPAAARAPARATPRATAVPLEVRDEAGFQTEVLDSALPVLVDFYASWCGPCKLVSPLMDWAAAEFEGRLKVVKVDTDAYEKPVREYGVHGLPTFAVFREGKIYGLQEGAMAKGPLTTYLEKYAPNVVEPLV